MEIRNGIGATALAIGGLLTLSLAGCVPLAGQMAEAGYNVAKTTLGGPDLSAAGADERQKKLQSILNSVDVGQEVAPVLQQIGEPPREKSGNTYGFTCYQFSAVYSDTDAAVIMAKDGKIAFYGNSRCSVEMQDANFKQDGKYASDSSL